jgi:hypothetical protein
MAVADRTGLPLAAHTAAATPHEVTLAPGTLVQIFTTELPERLIGDKAYDSDLLGAQLAAVGIAMIAPHRTNRKQPATQAGAPCAVTVAGGRWSACLPGCKISGDWWCATNTMPGASWVLCTWLVF